MSFIDKLFGEKCKCGERTKRVFRGNPTCDDCRSDILYKEKATKEETRKCPKCGTKMGKVIHKPVIYDRCPECKGVWLDRGELDKIMQMMYDEGHDDGGNSTASGFTVGFCSGMIVGGGSQ